MVDIEFLEQLVNSMGEAVEKLEKATEKQDKDEANKLRVFIFDMHNKIDEAIDIENV
jgi:uncharacterized membrane protein (DUF106 family)